MTDKERERITELQHEIEKTFDDIDKLVIDLLKGPYYKQHQEELQNES